MMTGIRPLWSLGWLAARSLLWTIFLPGFVAGYVPWMYFGFSWVAPPSARPTQVLGLGCITIGAVLLAACIVEFARSWRGTLSPADLPRHLVVRGPYRLRAQSHVSRRDDDHPRRSAVGGFRAVPNDRAIWFVAVNVFVMGFEEPTLRRQFGRGAR